MGVIPPFDSFKITTLLVNLTAQLGYKSQDDLVNFR